MVVLLDTNVVLDYLLTRSPYYEDAQSIMRMCAEGRVEGIIAFHSISNISYVLRRLPDTERRKLLSLTCQLLRVVGASHNNVVRAIGMREFSDFEDCLQDRCADENRASYIITRNLRDFEHSTIRAIIPKDLVGMLAN